MELTPLSHVLLCLRGVFLCLWLRWIILCRPALDLSFALWFGTAFSLLKICRSKVSIFLFKLLLNLDIVSIHRTDQGDVQEIHLILDVLVYTFTVLEYQIPLKILDTQLRVKAMKNVGKLLHVLVPSLPQCGPLYVFILIAPDRVLLLLDGISE